MNTPCYRGFRGPPGPSAAGGSPAPRVIIGRISTRAELSSLSSTLEDLVRRVTALAEQAADGGDEEAAHELFAVERALQGALRKLQRAGGI